MKESEIETHLRQVVEARGGRCVKFNPDYSRGWPDRLVILPKGILFWVELKAPGGRLSPAQMVAHEELRRLGQRVETVWSKEQAEGLLNGK